VRELVTEDVPETAYGMNEPLWEAGIDFLSKLFDVDVESVGFDVFAKTPDGFDDGSARDGAVGAAHKKFEKAELRGSEWEFLTTASDLAGGGIECEVGGAKLLNGRLGGAASDGTETGEKDGERERFDEIIVSARVEAGDDVGGGITGGEHEDGGMILGGTEAASDFDAVDTRHHDVEDDRIKGADGEGGEGFFAIAGEGDGVILLLKTLGEETAHGRHDLIER
jgi:hypothetical protein